MRFEVEEKPLMGQHISIKTKCSNIVCTCHRLLICFHQHHKVYYNIEHIIYVTIYNYIHCICYMYMIITYAIYSYL